MERGVKHRPRRRSPLPFLLLAVAVVGCAFAVAVAAVVPMEADSPGGQDQALPTPTLEEAERDKLDAPAAATPTPTPAPYIPDEAEVEMLARLIWGEARGIPSDMHKAAVVWCALNRVDAEGWPDTVAEVGNTAAPIRRIFAGLSGNRGIQGDCRRCADTVGAGKTGRRRGWPRPSR